MSVHEWLRNRWIIALCVVTAALIPSALVFAGAAPPEVCLLSAFVLSVAAVAWLRAHAETLLLVFLTTAFLATIYEQPWLNLAPSDIRDDGSAELIEEWRRHGPFETALPVVLHIVLDEMMSPGAIDPDLPGAAATRDAVYAFGNRHGFRTFDSVYSRYFWSEGALTALLNIDSVGSQPPDLATAFGAGLGDNARFADMAARGYRTVVFQSAALDFCASSAVAMCETFRSFDPAAAGESHLDQQTRVLHFWDTFFRAYEPSILSSIGRWVLRRAYGLDQRELGVLGVADRFDVQGFVPWFDRYKSFVSRVPRGTHVFAHMLVPHGPYLLSDTCVVGGNYDVGYFLKGRFPGVAGREEARRDYYEAYFSQLRCVVSKLDELMEAVKSEPALADAVVVIHGDHGARISAGYLIEDLSPRDFIDNYGAYFAIRAPNAEAGIDCSFLSLPEVFRQAEHQGRVERAATPLPVLVGSRSGENVVVPSPMPVFGCAAGS
jgi:hypothetical protein